MKKVKIVLTFKDRCLILRKYMEVGYEIDSILKGHKYARKQLFRRIKDLFFPKKIEAHLI